MQLGDHLGFASLAFGVIGVAIAILWPTKRWIGYVCLLIAAIILICWAASAWRAKPEAVKSNPVISWSPAPMKAGEPLTAGQLNAVASVEGKSLEGEFVYNPTFGTTLSAGIYTLSVSFVPKNGDYNPATKTVAVNVIESSPRKGAPAQARQTGPCGTSGPRIGTGPDAYKDVCDDQFGDLLIQEAKKLDGMVDDYINASETERKQNLGVGFARTRWVQDFENCCAYQVKEMRTEALRRLGPPAQKAEEEMIFNSLYRDVSPFRMEDRYSGGLVRDYIPYLRRFGSLIKQRAHGNSQPLKLPFTVQTVPSSTFEKVVGLSANDKRFPVATVVTVECKESIPVGWILLDYDGQYATMWNDLNRTLVIDGYLPRSLKSYMYDHPIHYLISVGKNPIAANTQFHITLTGAKPLSIRNVLLFTDELD